MILLNQSLRSHLANVVQNWVANPTKILHQVLAKALDKALDILLLPQRAHVLQPRLDPLPVVDMRFVLSLPYALSLQLVQDQAQMLILLIGCHLVHLLPYLYALVIEHGQGNEPVDKPADYRLYSIFEFHEL